MLSISTVSLWKWKELFKKLMGKIKNLDFIEWIIILIIIGIPTFLFIIIFI